PLAEGLRMVLGDTLLGRREPSVASSGFWMWDRWLRERLTPELNRLARTIAEQAAYADVARELIAALFEALQGSGEGAVRRAETSGRRRDGDPEDGDDIGSADREDESGTDFEPSTELFADDQPEIPTELLHAIEA